MQKKKHFAIINKSRTISGPQPYSWGPVEAIINTALHCKCIEDQEVPCIFCSDDVPLSLWYFISLLSLTAPGPGCYPRTEMDSSSWISPLSLSVPLLKVVVTLHSLMNWMLAAWSSLATSLQLQRKQLMFKRVSSVFQLPQEVSTHGIYSIWRGQIKIF